MFRQEEVFFGSWQEKTIEAMQRRRFDQLVSQLPPLGAGRLAELSQAALERRIELCWQDISRKPLRSQQLGEIWRSILSNIEIQADCLSYEEHALVERALILGGCARLEDVQELDAARALSLRLFASVGLVSGRPYVELEHSLLEPIARAFARPEHEAIRQRLGAHHAYLSGMLYRNGAIDDRQPQQYLLKNAFARESGSELHRQLIRRYLWSSYDCVDYGGGVMLVHPALAEPVHLLYNLRRKPGILISEDPDVLQQIDILPEEIPLQQALERTIRGALRSGLQPEDVARNLRLLCKQGAPLSALEDVLQSALIVYVAPAMRGALSDLFYRMPKWIECSEASMQ